MLKILVTGGRTFNDWNLLWDTLDEATDTGNAKPMELVHGMAAGADTGADVWGTIRRCNCTIHRYPVSKDDWKTRGYAAGRERNQRMLTEHPDIDLVVAFPGGPGTKDMVWRARQTNIEVREIEPRD